MESETGLRITVPGDDPPQIQGSPHLQRLGPYGKVTVFTDRPADDDHKLSRVRDAAVIINTRSAVTWPGHLLRRLPYLRLIATCSIGTDNIDLTAASDMGVLVCNQPGRTAPVVAEHLFGLMLAAAKRAAFQTAELKAGRWTKMDAIYLRGKTLGIVGTGAIGSDVARLGAAIGMRVIAWTFNPSPERGARLGVQFVELDTLLREAHVVSLHLRLSAQSRHLIGRRELLLMREGAILVNGGRAQLVDTEAMIEALEARRLGGAALDVFDQEPLPPDHPLLRCQQVVMTPHMADQTPEGIELLNEGAVDNVIAFLEGHPRNIVNPAP